LETTVLSLLLGFSVAFEPSNLWYAFLGCLVGTLVGRLSQSALRRIDVRWLDWLHIATASLIVVVGLAMTIGAWRQLADWR